MLHAGASVRGLERSRNQDRWCADVELGLFAVSDGMGGMSSGEVASEIVVQALPTMIAARFARSPLPLPGPRARERLRDVLIELNAQVNARARARPALAGMGATAVVALVHDASVLIGHIGDSRAYLWHAGRLRRLTRDHSLAQALVDAGEISADEAPWHPSRSQLTRHIGMPGDASPDARLVGVRPGDRLLLCSDGLSGALDDDAIAQVLGERLAPGIACRALVEAAQHAGGTDDVTALVVATRRAAPLGRVRRPRDLR